MPERRTHRSRPEPLLGPAEGRTRGPGRRRRSVAELTASRAAAAALGLLLLTAAAAPRDETAEAQAYGRCLQLARDDPGAGLGYAEAWEKRGGAHPAEHCLAVALIGLKRYAEAAAHLSGLAQAMNKAPNGLRADVLDQEGQAWLLAGDAGRAYTAADAAVALAPDDANLLVDRAEAAGVGGQYDKALADLDRVLQADPDRTDALIYRASAERALDRLDPALADAEKALRLQPDLLPGLLERGNIRRLKGDRAGAREDWLRLLDIAPGSPEAATARNNLAALSAQPSGGADTKPPAGPKSSP